MGHNFPKNQPLRVATSLDSPMPCLLVVTYRERYLFLVDQHYALSAENLSRPVANATVSSNVMTATDLIFCDASAVRFERLDGAADIRMHIGDRLCVIHGRIRRAFPLSSPDSLYSLQDESGREVGVLRDLDELDEKSYRILHEELNRRYFTPRIDRIVNLRQEGGMWTWDVETSRGPAIFYVRSWRDSSHEIQAGRFQIQSVDGQRFEIPSYDALDDRSKLFIEQLF